MPVARTLITGATGFIGSHLAALLVARGHDVAAILRPQTPPGRPGGPSRQPCCAPTSATAARCAARSGVDGLFHLAGTTNLAAARETVFALNVEGTRIVLEEALRAGVEPRRLHLLGRRDRARRRAARRPTRRTSGTPGATRIPTSTPSTRPRSTRCASPRAGCRLVIVNPGLRARPRRPGPLLDGDRAPLHAPRDPGLRRRHAQHRRRRGRRSRAPARRRARRDRRALHPRQPQLHPGPAVRRPRPAVRGRAAGGQAAARRGARAGAGRAAASAVCRCRRRPRCAARRCDWAFTNTKAKRELGWRPRPTRTAWRTTIAWYREHDGRALAPAGARQPLGLRIAAGALERVAPAALRGCTRWPPCTAASPDRLALPVRQGGPALRAQGIAYEQVEVPQRRARRDRGGGADRAAPRAAARARRPGDLRLAPDPRVPRLSDELRQQRSPRSALGGLSTPRSVTSALMSPAGVTSNAGLRTGVPGGVSDRPRRARTSSAAALLDHDRRPRSGSRGRSSRSGRRRRTDAGGLGRQRQAKVPTLFATSPLAATRSQPTSTASTSPAAISRPRPSRRSARGRFRAPRAHRRSAARPAAAAATRWRARSTSPPRAASSATTASAVPRPGAASAPVLQWVSIRARRPAGRRRGGPWRRWPPLLGVDAARPRRARPGPAVRGRGVHGRRAPGPPPRPG